MPTEWEFWALSGINHDYISISLRLTESWHISSTWTLLFSITCMDGYLYLLNSGPIEIYWHHFIWLIFLYGLKRFMFIWKKCLFLVGQASWDKLGDIVFSNGLAGTPFFRRNDLIYCFCYNLPKREDSLINLLGSGIDLECQSQVDNSLFI